MSSRLFDYPSIPMSIVCGLVLALLTAACILAVRRIRIHRSEDIESANTFADITLSVFSALYGILLGLLAVGAYENLQAIDEVVEREASAISALYWDFTAMPEPTRSDLIADLVAYAREVTDDSFADHAQGIRPRGEIGPIRDLYGTVISFEPQGSSQQALQAESLNRLGVLQDARHARLGSFSEGIPAILWWIVGVGAAITLLLICLFQIPLKPHLTFGCLLAFYIGSMIFVIAAMDNPFSGADRVRPEAIQELLNSLPMLR